MMQGSTRLAELDADDGVRVIVNTGRATRSRPGSTSPSSRDRERAGRTVAPTKRFELRFTAWHNDVWKPVIAAVNGVCAGGACTSWPTPMS